jgi:Tfp pilus assembly protein PilF
MNLRLAIHRNRAASRNGRPVIIIALLLSLSLAGCSSKEPETVAPAKPEPGTPVTEKAQQHIKRGWFFLHCFQHQLASFEFLQALDADPEAAIARCGLALSYYHPFADTNLPALLEQASNSMQLALNAKHATPADRSFVQATLPLFSNIDKTSHEQRRQEHHKAMAALHEQSPDDIEVAAALALSHLWIRGTPLKNEFTHEHAVEQILWPLRDKHLGHVGLLHYLILALDGTPEDARRALPAAAHMRNLSDAVPTTRSAPARLFFRLGMWPEAVHTTRAADTSALALLSTMEWPPERRDFQSAIYRIHALLNAGCPGEAKTVTDELRAIAFKTRHPAAKLAAFHARHIYLLEGRRWTEGIKATLDLGEEEESIMLAHAASVAGGFLGVPFICGNAVEYYKKRLDDVDPVQVLEVDSTLALINRDHERIHMQMKKAVLLESSRGHRSVIPSPPIPATELYGEFLLKMKLPGEAVQQFEQGLKDRANRPMALYGLARARLQLGQKTEAIALLKQLIRLWSLAEPDFSPLQSAKTLLEEALRPDSADAPQAPN